MKSPVETRSAPRRQVRLTCQAVRERGFRLLGDVALDVSSSGMLLRTDARVLTGEPVIVSLYEPTAARWFDAEATVARVVHGRRRGERGRCVGLRFESLTDDERARLAKGLERCAFGLYDGDSGDDGHDESCDRDGDEYGVFAASQ